MDYPITCQGQLVSIQHHFTSCSLRELSPTPCVLWWTCESGWLISLFWQNKLVQRCAWPKPRWSVPSLRQTLRKKSSSAGMTKLGWPPQTRSGHLAQYVHMKIEVNWNTWRQVIKKASHPWSQSYLAMPELGIHRSLNNIVPFNVVSL